MVAVGRGVETTRFPERASRMSASQSVERKVAALGPAEQARGAEKPQSGRLLVSLATYNEKDNLRPLVQTIREFAPSADVLVIDDNSPDGTGKIADELKAELPNIHVIHRSGKLGLGTAVLTGMKYAIDHGFDYFLNMDADFSHPPRFIPAILAGMDQNDVMIGSRYIPGGGVEGEFNFKRKFMSTGINVYSKVLLGLKTKDNSGSYRCYRVSKLALIDFDHVKSRGYSFMEEILFWCRVVGCKMGETPILFENRRSGISKINKTEAIKALQIIFLLGVDRASGEPGRRRRRRHDARTTVARGDCLSLSVRSNQSSGAGCTGFESNAHPIRGASHTALGMSRRSSRQDLGAWSRDGSNTSQAPCTGRRDGRDRPRWPTGRLNPEFGRPNTAGTGPGPSPRPRHESVPLRACAQRLFW